MQYSEKRASKDLYNREYGLKRLEKRIKSGRLTKANINNRGYNKYLKMEGIVNISIDKDKYLQDVCWDGLKGFNGKENDNEVKGTGNQQDYGFRIYDPRIGKFLSVDPLFRKYPELTTYQFASNTPIWGIDLDGLEVKVYTEVTGLTGHAFLTVGSGDNLIVYTYGRYLGGGKDKSVSASLDPSGSGVLVKLTGKAAQNYIKDEVKNKKAKSFIIKDVKDNDVKALADKVFENGRSLSEQEQKDYKMDEKGYGTDDDAKVIDEYKLLENNCTTKVVDVLKAAGTSLDFNIDVNVSIPTELPGVGSTYQTKDKVNTPTEMQVYLEEKSKKKN